MISKIKESIKKVKFCYHAFMWLACFCAVVGDNKYINKKYPTVTMEKRWRILGKTLIKHCKWMAEADGEPPSEMWAELKDFYYEEFREIVIK